MFELYCQSITSTTRLLYYGYSFIARVKYQMHCAGDIVSLFYSTARAPAKRFSTHSIYFEFFNLKSIEFLFLKFTYSTIIDSMKSVRSLKYSNLKLSVRTATALFEYLMLTGISCQYFIYHLSQQRSDRTQSFNRRRKKSQDKEVDYNTIYHNTISQLQRTCTQTVPT